MAVYQAPDITDRVAVGDDLYQIIDSGGKKKLIPDPTEVKEVGTPINKKLLQPLCDAVQRIDENAILYNNYWWRRRGLASSYVETRQSAVGKGYSHTSSSDTYYYLCAKRFYRSGDEEGTNYYATLYYSSSITINQSTGEISLNSPSWYNFSALDSVYDSSVYERFQGKFVKGFLGCIDLIFYIPSSAYMTMKSWSDSTDTYSETFEGYEFTSSTNEIYMPVLINSVKITNSSAWETISSSDSEAYPHSGESGGYEWVYCGRISDFAASLYPLGVKTVKLTSASWNNGTYTLSLPYPRYLFWGNAGLFLLVDSGKAYGAYTDYQSYSYDQQTNFAAGETSLLVGDGKAESAAYTLAFSSIGITITKGRDTSKLDFAYLPL